MRPFTKTVVTGLFLLSQFVLFVVKLPGCSQRKNRLTDQARQQAERLKYLAGFIPLSAVFAIAYRLTSVEIALTSMVELRNEKVEAE